MKKIITLAALALTITIGTNAQTAYDGAKLATKELNGTARFVGMGGAMGALGGDISTMGTNPAGIGIYRSNEIMATLNFGTTTTESNYLGSRHSVDADRFNFSNIGAVLSHKVGNYTDLRYVNFGINYSRSKAFYKNMSMSGIMDGVSQTTQILDQANAGQGDLGATNTLFVNGWLSALGWNSFLFDQDDNNIYYSELEEALTRDAYFDSRERGGINQFDFNVSFNFNDRFYLGATIGAYDVNYRKFSIYTEEYAEGWGYDLKSWNEITGTGVDFKLGAIWRPVEESPFRVGLAIHTPTFYNLTYATSAVMDTDLGHFDTYNDLDGDDMHYYFRLRTPWLYNISLGHTVSNYLALGAEYEYEDYSTIKFHDDNGRSMWWENSTRDYILKGVHTLRIGAELKPIPEFAIRAGYNYSTAAFKDGAYKILPTNSIQTDTDFANSKGVSTYTLGLGYRGSVAYFDVAYKYNTYKEDFYAFDNTDLESTDVKNNKHQVFVTLGMRF